MGNYIEGEHKGQLVNKLCLRPVGHSLYHWVVLVRVVFRRQRLHGFNHPVVPELCDILDHVEVVSEVLAASVVASISRDEPAAVDDFRLHNS